MRASVPNALTPTGQTNLPAIFATEEPASSDTPGRLLYRSLLATVGLAALFFLVVCGTLIWFHVHAGTNDPWKSPQLLALKDKLVLEPANDALKKDIQRLDLEFRQQFRRRLALDKFGAWLLLGGGVLLAVAGKQAFALKKPLPQPTTHVDAARQARRMAAHSRWAAVTTVALIAGVLVLVFLFVGTVLPKKPTAWGALLNRDQPDQAGPEPMPTPAELQVNSPRFRGWDGGGVSMHPNVPLEWDSNTGKGVAWKSPVLAPGHSSPVVWGNRLFISGATDKRLVFCYEASSGQLLWQRTVENVPGSPAKLPEVPEDTGYAAATPATDGKRIYAIFANGDVAALRLDGSLAWSKYVGPLKNPYGHATSLALWQEKLIAELDQGESSAPASKLLALNARTGRIEWEQARPVGASWATPIIIEAAGRAQIITLGVPWVIAYSPTNGTELWRADLLEGEIVTSPIFAAGLVVVASPSSKLIALRPDGTGNVTKTHVAWTSEENVPDVPSPVSNGELIFTVNTGGQLTCLAAQTGAKVWEHDLDMIVQASPALVGGRLLVLGEKGTAVVVGAEREFKELSRSQLPDKFLASPAFGDGRLFLRGETNLFCIGPAVEPQAKAR